MQETDVIINCKDGFKLTGTLLKPAEIKSAIMLAPATGKKRQFYAAFAKYLAENGFAVLTFDNRSIGQSIQGSINNGNPSLTSWGVLDIECCIKIS